MKITRQWMVDDSIAVLWNSLGPVPYFLLQRIYGDEPITETDINRLLNFDCNIYELKLHWYGPRQVKCSLPLRKR